MSSSLWLVRHGHTAAPPQQIVGHLDVALSSQGEVAVGCFAEHFAAAWRGDPPRLYTSDLSRTRQTAAPLAARWQCSPKEDARLRELHFGRWEGQTWAQVAQDDPRGLDHWMQDWVDTAPPAGESFRAVCTRVADWLAELPPEPTLVIAHAGALRALLCVVLALPPTAAFAFDIKHLQIACVERFGDHAWRLALLGASAGSLMISSPD